MHGLDYGRVKFLLGRMGEGLNRWELCGQGRETAEKEEA